MNETEFPPIEHATTEHYIKEVSKDKEAIFIDVKSEEQVNDSGCGPAVVADVLKTLGIDRGQSTNFNSRSRSKNCGARTKY